MKRGELRKVEIADTLGALLVTLKREVFHSRPPLPVEPVKSTISGSHEPAKAKSGLNALNKYSKMYILKTLDLS